MPAEIRALNTGDAEQFFELRRLALHDAPFAFAASPEDDLACSAASAGEILSRATQSLVFGAFEQRLLGMLGLYRDRHAKAAHKAHLWGMYIRPEARRQGLGRGLLGAAVAYGRSLDGVSTLRLSVSETAGEAKALYESVGFQVWGVEPEALRHDGRAAREFHMALDLTRGWQDPAQ